LPAAVSVAPPLTSERAPKMLATPLTLPGRASQGSTRSRALHAWQRARTISRRTYSPLA
jgi:hypothetical protein